MWSTSIHSIVIISMHLLLEVMGYTWSEVDVTGQTSVEYQLKKTLLRGYDITSRPVRNDNTATPTKIGVSLFHILDTNERQQTLSALLSIRCHWVDEYLIWNETLFNIKKIWIPARSIWRPDLIISNYANDEYSDYMNTNAQISSNGHVLWTFPIVVKMYCTLDVRYFPFDMQQCNMTFVSWTYDGYKLNLSHTPPDEQKVYFNPINQEWLVTHITPSLTINIYPCCVEPFPLVTFTIHMHRRCLFYVINTICPCLLIYLVSFLGFFLPIESGEKVNLEITVLLALVVFLLMMSETMPPTPDAIPILGLLFAVTMIMVALAVVMAVTVTRVYFNKGTFLKVPAWASQLALIYQRRHNPACLAQQMPRGIAARMRRVDLDACSLDAYDSGVPSHRFFPLKNSGGRLEVNAVNNDVFQKSRPQSTFASSCMMQNCANRLAKGLPSYPKTDDIHDCYPNNDVSGDVWTPMEKYQSDVREDIKDQEDHTWEYAAFQLDLFFFWTFTILTIIAFTIVIAVASPAFTAI